MNLDWIGYALKVKVIHSFIHSFIVFFNES